MGTRSKNETPCHFKQSPMNLPSLDKHKIESPEVVVIKKHEQDSQRKMLSSMGTGTRK